MILPKITRKMLRDAHICKNMTAKFHARFPRGVGLPALFLAMSKTKYWSYYGDVIEAMIISFSQDPDAAPIREYAHKVLTIYRQLVLNDPKATAADIRALLPMERYMLEELKPEFSFWHFWASKRTLPLLAKAIQEVAKEI